MPWDDNLDRESPSFLLASSDANVIRSLAGPGSGKSFAIKRRIARLMESGVPPEEILAITFTRTSAADLRNEIATIESAGAEKVVARTLHSHAMQMLLRQEAQELLDRRPRIIIEHELSPAFRDIQIPDGHDVRQKKALVASFVSGWATLQSDQPGYARDQDEQAFEDALVSWMKDHGALLVGEVIPLALRYLRNNPASPEIGKYQAILVDEYQDLNKSEQEFIRLFRGGSDIVIVGDDDQSIYGFKFAHPEGIRSIDTTFGEFTDITFDTIRRCPKKVTEMASALISRNPNRSLGSLQAYADNQDGIVQIVQWGDDRKEIDGLAEIIKREIASGLVAPGDILVLTPRRRIGYRLRDKLAVDTQVKSYFRESAIETDKVRRAYSLLFLLAYPDDKISLRYLLGQGSSDYRRNQYNALIQYAEQQSLSIRLALDKILSEGLRITGITTLLDEYRNLTQDLHALQTRLEANPEVLFEYFIRSPEDESDFYELSSLYRKALATHPRTDANGDGPDFAEWFKPLLDSVTEGIATPDSPENIDHIRIMSLHASKGLSAKFVIVTSMIEGLMPSLPQAEQPNELAALIEEQRRLFYVAITRCKSSPTSYPGRLLLSSFQYMKTTDAVRMRIPAGKSANTRMQATRFLNDFGKTMPGSVTGQSLL